MKRNTVITIALLATAMVVVVGAILVSSVIKTGPEPEAAPAVAFEDEPTILPDDFEVSAYTGDAEIDSEIQKKVDEAGYTIVEILDTYEDSETNYVLYAVLFDNETVMLFERVNGEIITSQMSKEGYESQMNMPEANAVETIQRTARMVNADDVKDVLGKYESVRRMSKNSYSGVLAGTEYLVHAWVDGNFAIVHELPYSESVHEE